MSGLVKYFCTFLLFLCSPQFVVADERQFNLGIIVSSAEVAGWDIDVRPDGLGAPVGSGNASDVTCAKEITETKTNEAIEYSFFILLLLLLLFILLDC